jgi:tetratricopeptide (TPR) repeat protein
MKWVTRINPWLQLVLSALLIAGGVFWFIHSWRQLHNEVNLWSPTIICVFLIAAGSIGVICFPRQLDRKASHAADQTNEEALSDQRIYLRQQLQLANQREGFYQDTIYRLLEENASSTKKGKKSNVAERIDTALRELDEGKTEEAEKIFREIILEDFSQGNRNRKETAEAARHLGSMFLSSDEQKGIKEYVLATELDPHEPTAWLVLGGLYRREGQVEKAIRAFQQTRRIGVLLSDCRLQALAQSILGDIYHFQHNLDDAEKAYIDAIRLSRSFGDSLDIANLYVSLGNVSMDRKDFDKAVESYLKSIEVEESLGANEFKGFTYYNLSTLFQLRKDSAGAKEMLEKSYDSFLEMAQNDDVDNKKEIQAMIGTLKMRLG